MKKETLGIRNMVLQKATENSSKQCRSLKMATKRTLVLGIRKR